MFSYRSTQIYLLGTEVIVHKHYKASEKHKEGKYPFYFEIKTPEEPYLLRCRASSQEHLDFWIETLEWGGCSYYPPLNQVLVGAGIPLEIEVTNSTPVVRERIQRSSSWSGREHKEEQDAARLRVKEFDDDFRISVIKNVGKRAWQGLQFTERLKCLEEAFAARGRKSPRVSTPKIIPLEDSIIDHPLLQTSDQTHKTSPSHRQTPHRSKDHRVKEIVEVEPKTPVLKSGIDLGDLGFSTGRNKKKDKLASGVKHTHKNQTLKKAKKSHFQTSQGSTLTPHPPSFSAIEYGAVEEDHGHDTPTATSRVVLNIGTLSAVEQTSPRKRQKVNANCDEERNKQREEAWVRNTSVYAPALSGVSPMRVKISLPLPRTKKMKKTASATAGMEQSTTKSRTSNKRMTVPVRCTASNHPKTAAVRREARVAQPRACTVRQVSASAVARWSVDQNHVRNMRPTELRKFEVAERQAFHRTRIKQITEGSFTVPQTRASLDSILRAHHALHGAKAGTGDKGMRSLSKSNRGQTHTAAQKSKETGEAESVRRAVAKCLPKHYGDSVLASRHCYVSSTLHSSGDYILYSHPAEYTAPVQFSESTNVHSPTTNHIVISPMTPTSKRNHPLVSQLERLNQSSSALNESKDSSLFNESVHTYTSRDLASGLERPSRQNTVKVHANAGPGSDLKIEQLSPIEKSDSQEADPRVKSPRRQTWAANQPSSWSLQSPVRRNSPLPVQSGISQLSPGTAAHARFKTNKQEAISSLKSDIASLDLKLSLLRRK